MNPGGGAGWDDSPLDVQIPDDARELARDVLAYRRELRAERRRSRLRRLVTPFARQGTIMPLLASILAVCLVAGAMLSVATFSPATAPATPGHHPTAAASSPPAAPQRSNPGSSRASATARASGANRSASPSSSSSSSNATTPAARSNPSSGVREPVPSGSPR